MSRTIHKGVILGHRADHVIEVASANAPVVTSLKLIADTKSIRLPETAFPDSKESRPDSLKARTGSSSRRLRQIQYFHLFR